MTVEEKLNIINNLRDYVVELKASIEQLIQNLKTFKNS